MHDSNRDESRATVTLSTTELGDAVVTDKEIEHSSVMEEFPLTIGEGDADEHEAAIDPSSSVDDSEAVAEDKVGQSPVTLDSKESAMLTNKDDTSVVENRLKSLHTESMNCNVVEETFRLYS